MRRLHKMLALLFAFISFTSVVDSAPSIQKAYFKPFVVRSYQDDYTTLVIQCEDENVQELKIE